VQLAYTILSPALGQRRHRLAFAAVDSALLGGPAAVADTDYSRLRARVVRRALVVGRRRPPTRPPRLAEARRARSAPAGEELVWLLPAARAAYALHHLEGLDVDATQELLGACGVGDPAAATELADRLLPGALPALA
jgi:hypothetical protein